MDIRLIPDLVRQWIDILQFTDHIHHDLPPHFRKNWAELPWSRYRLFYGVLVPVIIHDALLQLHDTTYSGKLRKVITAQALITGIFDDLFDRLHLPTERIRQLMETPDYIISSEYIEEHLCQYLYRDIFEHFTGSSKILEDGIQDIVKAQELSRKQGHPDLTIDKVLQITRKKGGNAVLFYRGCIVTPLTEEEKDFLYELGGLFQMTNDINDALKDQQSGERTFMTFGLSLLEIDEIFRSQIRKTFESRNALSNENYHIKGFFRRINILLARSLVTLERYRDLREDTASFDIRDIPSDKIISGLKIPFELNRWNSHYRYLNNQV